MWGAHRGTCVPSDCRDLTPSPSPGGGDLESMQGPATPQGTGLLNLVPPHCPGGGVIRATEQHMGGDLEGQRWEQGVAYWDRDPLNGSIPSQTGIVLARVLQRNRTIEPVDRSVDK